MSAPQAALTSALTAWVVGCLVACAGCPPTPTPAPAVDAAPVVRDIFTGATIDCGDLMVAKQRAQVLPAVETCLANSGPAACLESLVDFYNADAVACVARERGASAAANVQTGGDAREATIAAAARNWIKTERLGYR